MASPPLSADIHAEQPQQAVGDQVDQPHDGVGHLEQRVVDQRGRVRQPLGPQRGEGLWRHLGEDQDDQSQDAGAGRHRAFAADPQRDDRDQRGGEDIDEIVAQQDQADQAIRPSLAGAQPGSLRDDLPAPGAAAGSG